MVKYILRRILLMIPVLIGVSLVTFIIVRSIPGDPVRTLLGADARTTPEQLAAIRKSYGLDQPYPVQYLKWLGHIATGDFGKSLRTGRTLVQELKLRLPVTGELALGALVVGLAPALLFGTIAALKRNSAVDYATTMVALAGISVPNFFLATLLVLLFCFKLKWLPNIGYTPITKNLSENLKLMVLPSLSLGLPFMAIITRFARSAVLEVLHQDYVRTARAKGLGRPTVIIRHVIPNASIPVLTVVGIQVAALLGGAVIVEQIFALPGIGRYIFEAIGNRDYPVVQSVTIVMAAIFVTVSLVVDVLYAVLDPRLRER